MPTDAMNAETYLPGHSQNAIDFMAKRSLESHGAFFLPYLTRGASVLDCGCGAGTITFGLAERVAPGLVIGVDLAESQIDRATTAARKAGLSNVTFQTADSYELPFQHASFDRVFSHALMEHLAEPVRAMREFYRVLRPGGVVGICSPDWSGLLVAPQSMQLKRALDAYENLLTSRGGDLRVGHTLGEGLTAAGFIDVQMAARYECYPSLEFIGEYLAPQLEREGDMESAHTLRKWSQSTGGIFAQAWISAVGCKREPAM